MARSIRLSLPLFATVIVSLVLSAVAHFVCVLLYVPVSGWVAQPVDPSSPPFPIPIHPAAMTTIKSSRLGLHANDSDWDSILPLGEGFLYDPARDAHYLVSQYHQYHCLRAFRTYFLAQVERGLSAEETGHVDHCLVYMRQTVMCNADLTLEPATHKQLTPDGRLTNAVTGVGVTHRCRDWAQVRGYVEENYKQWKASRGGDVDG